MLEPSVLNPDAGSRILLFVDHASNHVPEEFDALGLREDALREHIGWDIGAAPLAHALAKRLSLTVLLGAVSRLVVDTNRDPSDTEAVPEWSDEILIPGNMGLPFELRRKRFEQYHEPFHDACARLIIDQMRRGVEPMLIGLHSFTPQMRREEPRPWDVSVMWGHDDALAAPLVEFFKGRGLNVGENEPYSGQPPASAFYTMARHGAVNRLPHVQIEVRNDQLADPEGIARWTNLMAAAFACLDDSIQVAAEADDEMIQTEAVADDKTIRTDAEEDLLHSGADDKTVRIEDEEDLLQPGADDKTVRIEDEEDLLQPGAGDKTVRIEDEEDLLQPGAGDKTGRIEDEVNWPQSEDEDKTVRTDEKDDLLQSADEDKTFRTEDEDKTFRTEDEENSNQGEDEASSLESEDEDEESSLQSEGEDELGPQHGPRDPDRD